MGQSSTQAGDTSAVIIDCSPWLMNGRVESGEVKKGLYDNADGFIWIFDFCPSH